MVRENSILKGYKKTRGRGDSEDWEVRKLGEIALDISSGKSKVKA